MNYVEVNEKTTDKNYFAINAHFIRVVFMEITIIAKIIYGKSPLTQSGLMASRH